MANPFETNGFMPWLKASTAEKGVPVDVLAATILWWSGLDHGARITGKNVLASHGGPNGASLAKALYETTRGRMGGPPAPEDFQDAAMKAVKVNRVSVIPKKQEIASR